jgi:hypothetical protein
VRGGCLKIPTRHHSSRQRAWRNSSVLATTEPACYNREEFQNVAEGGFALLVVSNADPNLGDRSLSSRHA